MRGRKRTPSAIRELQGNPGHRPIPEDEPQPEAGADMPELSAEAEKEWAYVAKQLEAAGVLTKLDGPALALYCEAYAAWKYAQKKVKTLGMVIKVRGAGLKINPWLKVAQQQSDRMLRILVEFGCTPASRSRVKVIPSKRGGAAGKKKGKFSLIRGGKLDDDEGDDD